MKRLILSTVITLSFALILPVFAQSPQRGLAIEPGPADSGSWGTYHALIIGINDYKEWPRLRTAVKDATVIRNILVERYGFTQKNVIMRTDKDASRLQIIHDLRYMASSMGENDNLLIYYAGHGQLDDLTGDGYWVPAEGKLKDTGTWLANSYVKAVLCSDKVKAKNVVVIADSCYSGAMLRGGPSLISPEDSRYREKLIEKAALRSRQVISSGGIEPVTDGGAEGHSLFAFYLIDALRKNDREVIDLENLFHTRVWKPMTEIGNQRPNVGRLRAPMDQDGQFVLYNIAWVREQQARLSANEAKKQEQARDRQKAAMVAAELELQRQRIEIEKQKLALEREQLAQKKALELERMKQQQAFEIERLKQQQVLELERLKIEKKKQDLEYTKSQTSLEEVDKKPKAKQLSASISHVETEGEYHLALFPVQIYSYDYPIISTKRHSKKLVNAISEYTLNDPRVDLVLSYDRFPGYTDNAEILSDLPGVNGIEYWTRDSIFSPIEPDWKNVAKVESKTRANFAVLVRIVLGHGVESTVQVYLYEFKTKTVYSKKDNGAKGAIGGLVQKLLKKLIREHDAKFRKG